MASSGGNGYALAIAGKNCCLIVSQYKCRYRVQMFQRTRNLAKRSHERSE